MEPLTAARQKIGGSVAVNTAPNQTTSMSTNPAHKIHFDHMTIEVWVSVMSAPLYAQSSSGERKKLNEITRI